MRRATSAAILVILALILVQTAPVFAQGAPPDLAIAMIDAPDPVAPGKALTFRISVAARGDRASSNVTMRTSVPAGTTFLRAAGPREWTITSPAQGGTGDVTATVASLAAGETAVFQVTVRVDDDLPVESSIDNTATVSGSTTDANPDNDTATTSTTVRPMRTLVADLSVSIDFLQEPVPSFGQLTTMIVVQNAGPMVATDVELRTAVPIGTTFYWAVTTQGDLTTPDEGGTGDVTCTIGAVQPNAPVILTLVTRVTAGLGGRIETVGVVSASSEDPELRNNTDREFARVVDAGPVADLGVSVEDLPEAVATNSEVTYRIVVQNNGPALAENVTSITPIPRGARFIAASAEQGLVRMPPRGRAGAVGWKAGQLAPGASASLSVTVRLGNRSGVPLTVNALVAAAATDTVPGNNSVTARARVLSVGDALVQWDPPDLSVANAPPTNIVVAPTTSDIATDAAKAAKTSDTRAEGDSPVCYNVYVSGTPNVATTPENLWTSVPPDQTAVTAPVAPSGSFFTVTATYPDGESDTSGEDGTGDKAGPTITSTKVKSTKITAKGTGFTDTAEMLFDGIPFADPAKIKNGTKIVQKGLLVTGQTVEQYMGTGTSFLIIVRNNDGGVTIWTYEK